MKKVCQYLEIDMPRCSNIEGTAPCASVATGDDKCFQSRATCNDIANFRLGYPQVESVTVTTFASDTTTHNVSMPATVAAGDLLLVCFTNDGNATVTASGFTDLGTLTRSTEARGSVFGKVAAGTEGGTTVNFVTSGSEHAAAHVFRILKNNWNGDLTTASIVVESYDPGGTTEFPDPPACEPGWGELPILWIVYWAASVNVTLPDSYPASFTNGLQSSAGSGTTGASVATAYMNATVESMDPGPFDTFNAQSGVVFTIAIRPFEYTKLRFSKPAAYLPRGISAFECVTSFDHTPSIVGLGTDIGERATLKVTCKDAPHPDTGPAFDKNLADRSYNPFERGTLFGKFRARHPYLLAAPCRTYYGFDNQPLSAMERRDFFLENTNGPSGDIFSFVAKDILKLLDGDKAQCPVPTAATSQSSLSTVSSSITLLPAGVGNALFPSSGDACIGGVECVSFTRSGDSMSITRAQKKTTAVSHDAGVRVQLIKSWSGARVSDIIYELCADFAGILTQYLPLATWRLEDDTFLNQTFTTDITEPTSVKKLISELIEQAGLAFYYSDADRLVHMQVLRPVVSSIPVLDETSAIMAKSLRITEQPNKRVSWVMVFFGRRNPTRPIEEESNYAYETDIIDADALVNYGTPAIKKIFSRWIPSGGLTAADAIGERLLARYVSPPRRVEFDLSRVAGPTLQLADGVRISAPEIQDATGERSLITGQVTSIASLEDRYKVRVEEISNITVGSLTDDIITIGASEGPINLRARHDQQYPVAEPGDRVIVYIYGGTILGSDSTSTPALDIEGFDPAVDIYIIVYGRIQGAGGAGGDGGDSNKNGKDGGNGGIALRTTQAINVDASLGEIWSGGGGGAGGGGGGGGSNSGGGGGGGGGAGAIYGEGGDKGNGNQDGQNGSDAALNGNTGGSRGGGGNGISGNPDGGRGGHGGDPGDPGETGVNGAGGGGSAGTPGDEGDSIDGIGFVTFGVWDSSALTFTPGATGTEDVRGPTS